jgi:hypothetical protein
LSWAVVVGADAVKTKEVVTPVAELTVTGETVKAVVAPARLLLVAIKFTAPVNPLAGVIVKVTPVPTAPDCTVTAPLQGVSEKSGFVVETKSTEARVPSAASSVPLEPL